MKLGGSTMNSWGTPALTRYSCGDCPSKSARSFLLLRNEKIGLERCERCVFVNITSMSKSYQKPLIYKVLQIE